MKDAYSFHADEASLGQGYRLMYEAYSRIFTRMGLKFRAVQADGGSIGGSISQEFHVLADSGEDAIVFPTATTTPPISSSPPPLRRPRRARPPPSRWPR
jgi:prolyl-tRNA synthetase